MLTIQAAASAGSHDIEDWMEGRRAYLQALGIRPGSAGRRQPHPPAGRRVRSPVREETVRANSSQSFGRFTYEPQSAEQLAPFRREQAAFDQGRRAEQARDWWFSIPALAPVALALAAESPALVGAVVRTLTRPAVPIVAPLRPIPPEPPMRPSEPLSEAEKAAIRDAGRQRAARAMGVRASDLNAQVHHRISLHFQHLMARADPNRLANLQLLEQRAHSIASNEWMAFTRGLNGRTPSQAELVAEAMKVDKMIEPYLLRPGVPRPMLPSTPPRLN